MKKCTVGPRHKWQFKNNVELASISKTTARISLKGLYVCACGTSKYGEHQRVVK